MGLTTAMYTGLTGLHAHQTKVETIGHNIANVNTYAFKGSRTFFQTHLSRTLSVGTEPGDASGGTNPMQLGRGVMVGSTQRTTSLGALETTGIPSDMALEGSGYFIVRNAEGVQYYTRDGTFSLNAKNQLVTSDGHYVQGWGVDDTYTIVPGTLTNVTIPLGQEITARATQNVTMDGVLSAAERIATANSVHASQALVAGGGGAATDTTALTDLRSAATAGTVLFADGDTITLSGAARGERDVAKQTFVVGQDGTTLGDFATWLQNALGIQTGDGSLTGNPGVSIVNGTIVINSNAGEPNAITIDSNDLSSSNASVALPFAFGETQKAEGGGVFTSFTVYDSLGNPVPVNATFTLDSTPNSGPVWRYFLEDPGASGAGRLLGTGTVAFDTDGNYSSIGDNQFSLDRSGSGAASPLTFTLDLSQLNGLATTDSTVVLGEQDGYPPGTLTGFSVEENGIITGVFSNGLDHPLGQVTAASFRNEQGLIAESDNLYLVGPNSGAAQVVEPGQVGTGQVRGAALELSNVDLTSEFIGLVTTSTGFQANSRVISTSNDMLDQLLLTLR